MPKKQLKLFFKLLSLLIIIMNFLKKFFGYEKKNEELKISLNDLPKFIQKNFETKQKDLEMESFKKISEIKYLFEKAKNLLIDIQKKELEEKENTRFNKAALTSKKQIENQLIKTLEKINPNTLEKDLFKLRAYSNESYIILTTEINSFRKNIAYTSIYLKDEMKLLGKTIQEIINNLLEMKKLFDENQIIFEFEKITRNVEYILEEKERIQKIDLEVEKIKKNIENKEKEKEKISNNIFELKKRKEYQELEETQKEKANLAEKKQQIRTEISSMVSIIEKPLQRFYSLVSNKKIKINFEKQELLKNFINNPLITLKKDLNGEKIKEILLDVQKAIENEQIFLKEKEKEKRLNALQELIKFDFFENIFWKLNEIQKKQNVLENKIKDNIVLKEINKLEKEHFEIEKEVENLIELEKIENTKKQKILDTIKDKKTKIIDFSEKILNKKIILENN